MITFSNKTNVNNVPSFEKLLDKMLPNFEYFAKHDQKLKGDNFDECVQDLTCVAYEMYMSLVNRGLTDRIFHTPITEFAIKRFRSGRRYTGMDSMDVLGEATRLKRRVDVESLEPYDDHRHSWSECFVTDGRINVANEVSFKIDCEAWMNTLDWKRREILERMLMGDTTNELAKQFRFSAGRISQLRRELYTSWKEYRNTYDKKHQYYDFIEELIRLAEEDERTAKDRSNV